MPEGELKIFENIQEIYDYSSCVLITLIGKPEKSLKI